MDVSANLTLERGLEKGMFSVLMSLYNKEEPGNLKECLESLSLQTLKADEVVIVYDGFVNETLKNIVNEYHSRLQIKTLQLETNVGLGIALQKGVEFCSNEIIARMDTDDICYPNRFQTQMQFLEMNPDVDLIGAGIIEFDEFHNKRLKILPENKKEIHKFALWKNPFNHMTVVFKKSAVLSVGGYQHHQFMEDYNLWLRMISADCNVFNLKQPLVEARIGSQMVIKRRGMAYIRSEIKLLALKRKLKFTGLMMGCAIFVVRSVTRVIPAGFLAFLYNRDRKKIR